MVYYPHIFLDKPNFDLMTDALKTQCIWEEHPRNITALLSGYPQPSVSWTRGDGASITPSEAYKIFFEPYWENGRRDEWMANLEVCSLFHFICVLCSAFAPFFIDMCSLLNWHAQLGLGVYLYVLVDMSEYTEYVLEHL